MEYILTPDEFWNTTDKLEQIRAAWFEYINAKHWTSFITLTFREYTTPDAADRMFRKLLFHLNKDLIGDRYKNKVKHSYFSYVKGIEYQKRDVIHFHLLTDRPINYELLHKFWNHCAGFAHTKIIYTQQECIQYITKYAIKDGLLESWFNDKTYSPIIKPNWWLKAESIHLQLTKTGQLLLLA